MTRRTLSSDLHLEPITAPGGASIIDMVEDAAEEMFDTLPGASRAALERDAQRTAEMDKSLLAQLLPQTRTGESPATVAMRPPRTEEPTKPEVPVEQIESERQIAQAARRSGVGLKLFVALALFAGSAAALWYFG